MKTSKTAPIPIGELSNKDTERFWSKVDKSKDCWEWTGFRDSAGYGRLCVNGKSKTAHRISLILALGRDLSEGMFCCHHCDNPKCVNPKHLYEGTPLENAIDKIARCRDKRAYGESSSNAKLTEEDVRDMRKIHSKGKISHRKLAALFGCGGTTCMDIVHRRTWQHC